MEKKRVKIEQTEKKVRRFLFSLSPASASASASDQYLNSLFGMMQIGIAMGNVRMLISESRWPI